MGNQTAIKEILTPVERLQEYTGKKYATGTANGLTQAIIDTLKAFGCYGERINVFGEYHQRRTRTADGHIVDRSFYSPTKSHRGTADVHGIVDGRAVMIEIKIGKDRQSKYQKQYQREVEKCGAVYYIAKDYNSFYYWLKELRRK